MKGVVEAFDEAVGLGTILGSDGARYPFHCTQIIDGSRTIDPGAAVTFRIVPVRIGRLEAFDIVG